MEIDLELNLVIAPERIDVLEKSLAPSLEIRRFERRKGAGVRWREGITAAMPIDAAICDFMKAVQVAVSTDDTRNAEMRVGVFVTQDEAASMTTLLSATTVQTLAEFGLALEVSFYPCADEDDEV